MSMTSLIRYVEMKDSTATDGSGKTGLAFSDFTAKYVVQGGTLTALTTEDITTLGTYQAPTSSAHIRIKELNSAAPTKGIYEVHFHNTQLANTGKTLWLFLSATGGVPVRYELNLLPYADQNATNADNLASAASNYSATRGLAGTALPAVASGNAGALLTAGTGTAQLSTSSGQVLVQSGTGSGQLSVSSGKVAATLAAADVTGNVAADLQTIKTQTVTCAAGVTVLASVGTAATSTAQTGDSFARIGAAGASLTALGDARIANLDATVSSRLAGASYTAPANASIAAIKAKTDNLPTDPADQSLIIDATNAILARIGAPAVDLATDIAAVKSDTAAILLDTGTDGVVVASGAKTGYSLSAAGLDLVLVDGKTLPAALQIMAASVGGKVSGAGTGTEVFVGLDGATTRMTVTVDASGNRTAVVYG